MKKVLSVILSVVLMITVMPMNSICEYLQNFTMNFLSVKANAADESVLTFELSGDGDSYIITKCNESAEGNLTIPSEYNGKPVTEIGEYAFSDCINLLCVTIPESVTVIGDYAFYGCSNFFKAMEAETDIPETAKGLKSVIINGNDTVIGEAAFAGCSELESVKLYNVAEIGSLAFYGCSGSYMEISSGNEPEKTSNGLKSVIIDGSDTVIGPDAFGFCLELESVTLDGVCEIGDYAFEYCIKLSSVTIPKSVTHIGEAAFSYCCSSAVALQVGFNLSDTPTGLKSVIIDGNKTVIGPNAFSLCLELESVTLDGVSEIGSYAFAYCVALSTVTIPESVTYIGKYAFSYCCSSVMALEIGEDFFETETGLKSVIINGNDTVIDSYAFSLCLELESVTLDGVCEIGSYAFARCVKLSSVTIPESVTYIGESAFSNCSSSYSVLEMGMEPPENPTGLYSVIINGKDVTIDAEAFADCDRLDSISLSGVTSVYGNAFEGTAYFNDSSKRQNGVLYIDDCLIDADGEILSGDYTIKDGTSTVAINAFLDCDNLKSLTVPDCVENFGWSAYYSQIICNCSSPVAETLEESFPETLTVNHNNQFLSETPATCTQHGSKTYICDVCKTQTDVETPILSHDFSEEWTIDENPTCIKEGVKSHHCKNCSATTDVTSVPVISHTYGEWITDTEPTLTEEGLRHHICTVCKDTVYENIPMYLTFKLNSDKKTYTVVSCDNSFSGDLVIPEEYNGKPVTNIGSGAFAECTKITTATIPKDITVGEEAFSDCSPDLVIKCRKNSSAYQYATSDNIKYELILLNIDCTENSFIDENKKVIVTDNQEVFFIQEIVSAPSGVEAVCENHDKTAKRYYGTGDIISVYSDGVFVCNYTLVVNNDLDGDGICDVIDIELAEKFTAGVYEPTDAQVYALTNSLDEEINASDYQNIVNIALSR